MYSIVVQLQMYMYLFFSQILFPYILLQSIEHEVPYAMQ